MKIHRIIFVFMIFIFHNCFYRMSYNQNPKFTQIENDPVLILKKDGFKIDDTEDTVKNKYQNKIKIDMELGFDLGLANHKNSILKLNDKEYSINTNIKLRNNYSNAKIIFLVVFGFLTLGILNPIDKHTLNINVKIKNNTETVIVKDYEVEVFYELFLDSIYYWFYNEKQSELIHKPLLMEYYGNFIPRDLAKDVINNCYILKTKSKPEYCKHFKNKLF